MKSALLRFFGMSSCAITLAIFATGCPGQKPETTGSSPSPTSSAAVSPGETGITVNLVSPTGTEPKKPEMSASAGTDHIRWSNQTTVDRKIHFTVDWPFLEPSGDFTVKAGEKSAWYSLDPAKVSSGGRPFPYEVTPPLTTPQMGPDEPEISGQP